MALSLSDNRNEIKDTKQYFNSLLKQNVSKLCEPVSCVDKSIYKDTLCVKRSCTHGIHAEGLKSLLYDSDLPLQLPVQLQLGLISGPPLVSWGEQMCIVTAASGQNKGKSSKTIE